MSPEMLLTLTRPSRPSFSFREKRSVCSGPRSRPWYAAVRAARTISCATMCSGASCASAGTAPAAKAASSMTGVRRMSVTLLLEPGHDSRRARLVALAHFVDQRHRVLQQRDFRLEVLHQALLRRLARRLRANRGAALVDRLVDHREVLLQRRRGARIERVLLGVGDLLEAFDRVLVVRFRLAQLVLDRLRGITGGHLRTAAGRRLRSRAARRLSGRGAAPGGRARVVVGGAGGRGRCCGGGPRRGPAAREGGGGRALCRGGAAP